MTRYGNRGQKLEDMIEASNRHYMHNEEALVQKIPTPVKVLNINNRTGKITNGFYEKKSTVDYVGVYKGKSIAFDAKQTTVDTRFDLSNVKSHQYHHLKKHEVNGGISFLVVHFSNLNEFYYLPFDFLRSYWESAEKGGRKSIPYVEFESHDHWRIGSRGLILVDYLSVLEEVENE